MIVNAADFHVRPYAQGYKGFERTKNDPCKTERKFTRITRMELIFNARQLSRCPELPAGHGNYACWQKSTASSSEQRRNSRLQDGKTLEGLQTRPDPVYEPMSVNHILRLGQKESRWTPQQESSGIRFYRFLMRSSQISRRILRSCTFTKSGFQHRSLPQFGLHHPRTGLLLPLWRGRMRNIRHRVPVPVPAHCYNPPPHHKIPYTP